MTTRPPCAPGLIERSRAMHAEMDAAPRDEATQAAIMECHWIDALRAGNVAPDDHATRNTTLSCLYHGSPCREDVSAARMALGLGFLAANSPDEKEP
jgi:hypothetical protein